MECLHLKNSYYYHPGFINNDIATIPGNSIPRQLICLNKTNNNNNNSSERGMERESVLVSVGPGIRCVVLPCIRNFSLAIVVVLFVFVFSPR